MSAGTKICYPSDPELKDSHNTLGCGATQADRLAFLTGNVQVKSPKGPALTDYALVNAAAPRELRTLLACWLSNGRINDREYEAPNLCRTDRNPASFNVNTRSGRWSDFATGDKAAHSRSTHRWGSKGSLVLEVTEPKGRLWRDYEAGEGSDLPDLIQRQIGCSFPETAVWCVATPELPEPIRTSLAPTRAGYSERHRGRHRYIQCAAIRTGCAIYSGGRHAS